MRRFIAYLNIAIISITLTIIGCRDISVTQSSSFPKNNQVLAPHEASSAVSDKVKTTENRYIVTLKAQSGGVASRQAAQMAVETTNTIFKDLGIPEDSLVHQYQWASQGFAGRFSPGPSAATPTGVPTPLPWQLSNHPAPPFQGLIPMTVPICPGIL